MCRLCVFLPLERLWDLAGLTSGAVGQVCLSGVVACFPFCPRGDPERFGTPANGAHKVRLHLAKDVLATGGMCP